MINVDCRRILNAIIRSSLPIKIFLCSTKGKKGTSCRRDILGQEIQDLKLHNTQLGDDLLGRNEETLSDAASYSLQVENGQFSLETVNKIFNQEHKNGNKLHRVMHIRVLILSLKEFLHQL